MKYLVNGALGRMGQAVINSVKAQGGEVVAVDCNFQEKAGYKSFNEQKAEAKAKEEEEKKDAPVPEFKHPSDDILNKKD